MPLPIRWGEKGCFMEAFGMFGQLLIGLFFVFMAIYNFTNRNHFQKSLKTRNLKLHLPMWILGLAVLLELLGGVGVTFGFLQKLSAIYLICFTLVVSFWLHPFWQFKGHDFWKHLNICASNLAIIGGLLMILFMYG
jgi:uncharacterized membrane protein YphA (DoxX/SURF4 family)